MTAPDFRACAAAGAAVLQQWYSPSAGLWNSTGWWNSANALTAVIRYASLTGDTAYQNVIGTTYAAAQHQHAGFINDYYDDNGWWALAWVAAYDLTGNPAYLDAARTLFAANRGGWDGTCGGGMWWSTARTYKNAIATELFLLLAARLHQRIPGDQYYLTWAMRAWAWFSASGLAGPDALVNDGLTAGCANNGQTAWTYNQGVILGGLTALYQITADPDYLTAGEAIANAALATLVSPPSAPQPGILAEPCEAAGSCNGDQAQFKGIFMRHLSDFWQASGQPAYQAFITACATSLLENDQDAAGRFGLSWTGPFDSADAARQSSALDCLNAAIAVSG